MNEPIKAGEAFKPAALMLCTEGKIVSMGKARNHKEQFVMAPFDAGTGLSEHAARGQAKIFALDGEGGMGYNGKEHPPKPGESFHAAKAAHRCVKAAKRFKTALPVTPE